jgi:FlaA1/EpsC-like NDP-sugar epimerase
MLKRKDGVLPITDPAMTRFNISLADGVEMVLYALENAWGGELFVPKIPSYRITDVAMAIGPNCKHENVGIRPGEKIHEEMITVSDSFSTYDLGRYFAILPQVPVWQLSKYLAHFNAIKVSDGFSYNSGTNSEWLTIGDIQRLIRKDLDPAFEF